VRWLAILALALASPAGGLDVPSPSDGENVRSSAVRVAVTLDDPAEEFVLHLNDRDVTSRVRGTGTDRSLVLAGLPGRDDAIRYGTNRLRLETATARVERVFRWRPRRRRIRVIAVGNKIDFAAYETMATWRAEVDRIFDTFVRPHLATTRPNLVVLTEDFGLPTGLIGSRGAASRAAKDADPLTALAHLFVAYGPQAAYYSDHFALPGSGIQPLARALTLALTDQLWRPFGPVLSAKARQLGVWLVAATNVAPIVRSTDPEQVAFFGDVDDPARTDVFLPAGIDVYNTAFLWGPDGTLVGRTRKVFLTPPEEELLNLSHGALDDVSVFDTPAGRLGIAISKDAFVPDYVHRLDDLGATLVLQPDANPGLWATPPADVWQPDEWTTSVLGMLRPDLPNLTYNACPMMTGNFFPGTLDASGFPTGILFDGQSTITRRTSRPPRRAFVAMAPADTLAAFGFPLRGEFAAVSPWAFPDPRELGSRRELEALAARCRTMAPSGRRPRSLTLDERRDILGTCARTMLPGGANADGYRESVVAADLAVPVDRALATP
jgi:hypothetical protein